MKHIKARFDSPSDSHDVLWDRIMVSHFEDYISQFGIITKATYAHEISVKSKKHHYHNHLTIDESIPRDGVANKKLIKGLSSGFKRYMKEKDLNIKNYAIIVEDKSVDDQWYGYLFKDIQNSTDIDLSMQHGFTEQEIHNLWTVATALRKKSLAEFNKYENKLNNDKQSWTKLCQYLDENVKKPEPPPNTDCHVSSQVIHSYWNELQYDVGVHIIRYNQLYNDHKIPMKNDILRKTFRYISQKDWADATILYSCIV